MIWIDWLIVLVYLVLTLWLGLYLSRRASGSLVDFFCVRAIAALVASGHQHGGDDLFH